MKLITLGTTCSEKTDKMAKMKSNIKYLKENIKGKGFRQKTRPTIRRCRIGDLSTDFVGKDSYADCASHNQCVQQALEHF